MTRLIEKTNIEAYIAENRGRCSKCKQPIFWASTRTGKRIPMDFPHSALGLTPTHELVLGYGEGQVWDGTCEAWPSDHHPSHSCHFDTCKANRPAPDTHDAAMRRDREAARERAAW